MPQRDVDSDQAHREQGDGEREHATRMHRSVDDCTQNRAPDRGGTGEGRDDIRPASGTGNGGNRHDESGGARGLGGRARQRGQRQVGAQRTSHRSTVVRVSQASG